MTTGGYTLLQAPRPAQKLVHIHAGAEELGRVYAADLMLQAAMACAAHGAGGAGRARRSWRGPTGHRAAHADYEANLGRTPVAPLDMAEVVKTLQRLLPDDTVYTNGAGNYSGWLHRYCRYPGLQHHGRTPAGADLGRDGLRRAGGGGRGAAAARALGRQHRRRRRLPDDRPGAGHRDRLRRGRGRGKLISVVVDNGSYGTIRMHQEREYPGRVSGSDLFNPDFAALARAYGWRGEIAARDRGASPRRCCGLSAGRPTLLHLKLDTDVITSRTTLTAIRAAVKREKRWPADDRPQRQHTSIATTRRHCLRR